MEGSHSGLVHTLGKRAGCQSPREFESLTLRPFKIPPIGGYFVGRRRRAIGLARGERFEELCDVYEEFLFRKNHKGAQKL